MFYFIGYDVIQIRRSIYNLRDILNNIILYIIYTIIICENNTFLLNTR